MAFNSAFIGRFIEACGSSEPSRIQRLLNISNQAARNYLNGRLPDSRVLLTLAERTPYSIHWLLTGAGEKYSTVRSSEPADLLARQIGELIKQEVHRAVTESRSSIGADEPKVVVLKASDIRSETPRDVEKTMRK